MLTVAFLTLKTHIASPVTYVQYLPLFQLHIHSSWNQVNHEFININSSSDFQQKEAQMSLQSTISIQTYGCNSNKFTVLREDILCHK